MHRFSAMSETTEPSQNLDDDPYEKDPGESFHAPRMAGVQSSELRSRRYRSGLKNQMIRRVVNQASKTPRTIETSASTTSIQRRSAGSWMSSICRADQGVGERPLTVSRELILPCLLGPRPEAAVLLVTLKPEKPQDAVAALHAVRQRC